MEIYSAQILVPVHLDRYKTIPKSYLLKCSTYLLHVILFSIIIKNVLTVSRKKPCGNFYFMKMQTSMFNNLNSLN